MSQHNLFDSRKTFTLKSGKTGIYYSLAALEKAGLGKTSRLPVSLRVVLESMLRNCDGAREILEQVGMREDEVARLRGSRPLQEGLQPAEHLVGRRLGRQSEVDPVLLELRGGGVRKEQCRLGLPLAHGRLHDHERRLTERVGDAFGEGVQRPRGEGGEQRGEAVRMSGARRAHAHAIKGDGGALQRAGPVVGEGGRRGFVDERLVHRADPVGKGR